MHHIKGPDFPTGGTIIGLGGIRTRTRPAGGGCASGACAFEQLNYGKEAIIVTELPFMVKKGGDNG
jgi:DNA gyrase subunit A